MQVVLLVIGGFLLLSMLGKSNGTSAPGPVKNPVTPQGGPTGSDNSTSPGTVAGQGDTSGNPNATPAPSPGGYTVNGVPIPNTTTGGAGNPNPKTAGSQVLTTHPGSIQGWVSGTIS